MQRWRSFLGLTIVGGMLVWGCFLDPGSVAWLSGMYTAYCVLCVIASLASIGLVLQEASAAGRRIRLEDVREVRRAHQEFSARQAISETPRGEG